MSGQGYDQDVYTFSPDGRIFQVEYAAKAVDNSGTTLGLCCKDGVVLATEKILASRMLVEGSSKRTFAVDEQAGVAVVGLLADGRAAANKARSECADYRKYYGVPIDGHVLADRIAMTIHMCTTYWRMRPYGCALLVASYAEDGPQLYMVDPSGAAWGYHGCALGKGKQVAKTELEKTKLGELTCREAVKILTEIIYKVHDDTKDKIWEVELSWVCDESNRQFGPVPKELADEAIAAARTVQKAT
eukprot:TRINITY_DN43496_c0_g1_i1.p1 TRINITY_DN43496_c0_g1~~TRINITY_DN43496_c0_g1_i1.p1  ORF type:complete len:245 (-),score=35.84 TRINITY_DN43496_c0_g1_i1:76-810(-)